MARLMVPVGRVDLLLRRWQPATGSALPKHLHLLLNSAIATIDALVKLTHQLLLLTGLVSVLEMVDQREVLAWLLAVFLLPSLLDVSMLHQWSRRSILLDLQLLTMMLLALHLLLQLLYHLLLLHLLCIIQLLLLQTLSW